MKKGFFSVIILFFAGIAISGCIKNTPYVPTSNPSMTAKIDNYTFVASTVVSSVADTQAQDSASGLIITGKSSDKAHPFDYIKLRINKYKNTTQVFSIVKSEASAQYYHNGKLDIALGGVVTVTAIGSSTINGYFSFDSDSVHVRDGNFVINKP